MRTMLDRVLLAATLCISVQAASADPLVLYGPFEGSATNTAGMGLACVDKFSTASTSSDFLMGFPALSVDQGDGFVRVVSGADGTSTLFTLTRTRQYGFSGSSIGDVNGDGAEEVIIGNPFEDFAFLESDSRPSVTISATSANMGPGSRFGHSVAGLFSSIGGSLRNTVVVGAPNFEGAAANLNDGSVAFFDSNNGEFLHRCDGSANSAEEFGTALASIEDLNGDGVREILVSAPLSQGGNGRVDILSANSGAACTVLRSISGVRGEQLGKSLAAVGDQDGDGAEDFIAGGPEYTDLADTQGSALLVSGATGGVLCLILGTEVGELFGSSVAGIGDANYDGRPDFAVGAPGKKNSSGQIIGYSFDRATGTCSTIFTIDGSAREKLGKNLAGTTRQSQLCDMNNDGYPEFLVGTGLAREAQNSGSTIVFSIPTPTPTATPTPSATPTRRPRPTRTPTVALPGRSRLTFRISENGRLVAVNSLDRDPKRKCTVRLQARYSRSDLSGVSTTRVLVRQRRSTQFTKFQASDLPKTELEPTSGKPYILHMIARNYCGNKTFASNVASRYLTCGVKPSVSVETFTAALAREIR